MLCRRWNWRQDARSLVGIGTVRAVVTIQSNGEGDIEAAAADLTGLVLANCGGRAASTIADRSRPIVDLQL
ncbi:MAG: hypothetical protein J0H54_00185 [Rhizobiales bacterium]|nr:hypothetical protein [Hyphomicrobiales bacterium]